ncbi:hypothetical protein DAH22_00035 [Escherichia coli]|nr:hypothetical protein DAH22_00035 [Escherichia coli]
MALTHRELCQIAYKFLKRNGFKVCFHDRFIAVTSTGEQPDAMGFRNSASCLIEAKCSRADLLADRKKRFRKNPSLGMGDWRFFISEPGIISIEDLPPGWGLLHSLISFCITSSQLRFKFESDRNILHVAIHIT